MKLKIVIHEAEEGGYWTEVPALPGCAIQGDTFSLVPKILLGNALGVSALLRLLNGRMSD